MLVDLVSDVEIAKYERVVRVKLFVCYWNRLCGSIVDVLSLPYYNLVMKRGELEVCSQYILSRLDGTSFVSSTGVPVIRGCERWPANRCGI